MGKSPIESVAQIAAPEITPMMILGAIIRHVVPAVDRLNPVPAVTIKPFLPGVPPRLALAVTPQRVDMILDHDRLTRKRTLWLSLFGFDLGGCRRWKSEERMANPEHLKILKQGVEAWGSALI